MNLICLLYYLAEAPTAFNGANFYALVLFYLNLVNFFADLR